MNRATLSSMMQSFGISEAAASGIVHKLVVAAQQQTPLLGFAVDRRSGVIYYYVRELGEGTYGKVFAASTDGSQNVSVVVKQMSWPAGEVDDNSSNDDSTAVDDELDSSSNSDNTESPQSLSVFGMSSRLFGALPDTLGRFFPQSLTVPHDNYEFERAFVEREYRISNVIRRRLGHDFCLQHAVCAVERFYSYDRKVAFIIFPHRNAIPLDTYLAMYVHSRMREVFVYMKAAGMQNFSRIDLMRASRLDDEVSEISRNVIEQVRDIQLRCGQLFVYLATGLAMMHEKHMFHQDLKTDNVLVDTEGRPLFIDFGLACAEAIEGDAEFQNERKYLQCAHRYNTTADFEDPLAHVTTLHNDVARIEAFGKFDTYAAAKLAQIIFDPSTLSLSGIRRKYPEVENVFFMPEGLHRLLVMMTGESGYSPPKTSNPVGFNLNLTREEYTQRMSYFNRRPTMGEVVQSFSQIYTRWSNDLTI